MLHTNTMQELSKTSQLNKYLEQIKKYTGIFSILLFFFFKSTNAHTTLTYKIVLYGISC